MTDDRLFLFVLTVIVTIGVAKYYGRKFTGFFTSHAKMLGKMLRLSKVFLATMVANFIGMTGNELLLVNNLVGEFITYAADSLIENRFDGNSVRTHIVVRETPFTANIFRAIRENVLRACIEQDIPLAVIAVNRNGRCEQHPRKVFQVEFLFHGMLLCVVGSEEGLKKSDKDTDDIYMREYQVSSPDIPVLSDIQAFLERVCASESTKTDSEYKTDIYLKPKTEGFSENCYHGWLSTALLEKLGSTPTGVQVFAQLSTYGRKTVYYEGDRTTSAQFIHRGKDIFVESYFDEANTMLWRIQTDEEQDFVIDFLQSLSPKKTETDTRVLNSVRWCSSTVEQAGKPCVEWGWKEQPQLPTKTQKQYFVTKTVETCVIDSLSRTFTQEKMRARLGIGMSDNFLLHGQPGTGKTSLAYHIAQMVRDSLDRSVSIVHLDSKVFSSSDMFIKATRQLDTDAENLFPTQIVIIDEVDKIPFFRRYAEQAADKTTTVEDAEKSLDMSSFLAWLDNANVAHGQSRFVFAMMNDLDVITRANEAASDALFRHGRFGKRVHVGGCDGQQFSALCKYVLELHDVGSAKLDQNIGSVYKQVLELCDKRCGELSAPLTVRHAQELIVEADFVIDDFLKAVHTVFCAKHNKID